MSLAGLKKELRLIVGLISQMQGNISFAEDLVVLDRTRRAILAAITVEHARHRRRRRARSAVVFRNADCNDAQPERVA
jgi:hypothetical protein